MRNLTKTTVLNPHLVSLQNALMLFPMKGTSTEKIECEHSTSTSLKFKLYIVYSSTFSHSVPTSTIFRFDQSLD